MPDEQELSFADDLRAALAEAEAADAPAAPEPAPASTPDLSTQHHELEATRQALAERDAAEPPAEIDPDITIRSEVDDLRRAGQLQPPEHWSADDKAFFTGLPSDQARERVLGWRTGIERGAQEKFTAAATATKAAEAYQAALAPLAEVMQAAQIDAPEAVRRLVAAEQMLRTDPIGGFTTLISQYGAQIAGTEQAKALVQHVAQALGVDAGAVPLLEAGRLVDGSTASRFAKLESELVSFRRERDAAAQREAKALNDAAASSLSEFVSAKAPDGASLYPHFEAVRYEMAALMATAQAAGQALDLPGAYARAVWSRPELRDGLIKAQQAQAAKDAAAASRASLDRARNARTPRTASSPVANPDDDVANEPQRETIRRVMADLAGGDRV